MSSSRREWQALESIEDHSGTFCVDIFCRHDGSYGFELFRREPEDQGRWTILNRYATARFTTADDAHNAAIRAVPWLADVRLRGRQPRG